MSALVLLALGAWAQDVTGGDVPDLNAQLFRPSVDSDAFLWTDEASIGPAGPSARVLVEYVNGALVYRPPGEDAVDLIGSLFQLDVLGAYAVGPVRIGLHAPVTLRSMGDVGDGETGLGDIAVDAKGQLLDRETAGIGIALSARVGLPTATTSGALGSDQVTWEAALVLDREFGNLLLAGNIGTRGLPRVALENFTWDDQLAFRVGGAYAASEHTGISLDVAGGFTYASGGSPYGTPVEALLGGWYRPGDGPIVMRLAGGTGLTGAVGAPRARAVLGVAWEPREKAEKPPPPPVDTDGDGLLDNEDECPDAPEIENGWDDLDGCPDALTRLTVRVLDENGAPIAYTPVTIDGATYATGDDGGVVREELMPGTAIAIQAFAPLHISASESVELEEGEHLVELKLALQPGTARLGVTGPKGEPLTGEARFRSTSGAPKAPLEGAPQRAEPQRTVPITEGKAETELPSGDWAVAAVVEGYGVQKQTFHVDPGAEVELQLKLKPAKVKITKDEIVILDKVFFDSGKATIKSASLPLLSEVAEVLLANPQVRVIEVQGHTDDQGSDSSNLDLSQRRVEAVREVLVGHGVAPERLVAKGYGEAVPIADNKTSAGRAENRRVQFVILEQDKVEVELEVAPPSDAGEPAPIAPEELPD